MLKAISVLRHFIYPMVVGVALVTRTSMVKSRVMEQTMPSEETGTGSRNTQQYKNQGRGSLKLKHTYSIRSINRFFGKIGDLAILLLAKLIMTLYIDELVLYTPGGTGTRIFCRQTIRWQHCNQFVMLEVQSFLD